MIRAASPPLSARLAAALFLFASLRATAAHADGEAPAPSTAGPAAAANEPGAVAAGHPDPALHPNEPNGAGKPPPGPSAGEPGDGGEPSSTTGTYSPYEQTSIDQATARLGAGVDPHAEGKIIEGLEIVTLDVIEPRDPAPGLLNIFHSTSRRYVIEREVLLAEGETFRRVLCDETARNLRALKQLSLVVCTAIEGSAPDRVRVLVITKDVWSLRLGWDVEFIGGGLEFLQLVPTETNLGGTQQTVYASYIQQPESRSLSFAYRVPRVGGRRLSLTAEAGAIWNRNGEAEGSLGSLTAARPLYSSRTEWAWAVGTGWTDQIARRYVNARLYHDARGVPWEYRARKIAEGFSVTRSFGWATKHDLTAGAEMNIAEYLRPEAPGVDRSAVDAFMRTSVPTSDTRVGPFLQYRSYTSNFLRVLDFETLGLQEDFRLGHDAGVRAYPIFEALGSSRTFIGTQAGAQYTIPLGDGLVRGSVESLFEADGERVFDGAVDASLRIVTPRLGFGRLVFDARALHRYRNYLKRANYMGGGDRLRGYPSNFFRGKDLVAYNLELRSRPVQILSCQLGMAAFYDVGHAADGFDHLHPRHSVGIGLRVLFPQLDRIVLRGDVGFPIASRLDPGVSPVAFTLAFEQAFPLASVATRLPPAAPTGWLGQ